MRIAAMIMSGLTAVAPAFAQTGDEAKIRALIAEWYERVSHPQARQPWVLMAPGSIEGGPGYAEIPYQPPDTRSAAAYSGPLINHELAARALRFVYDVDELVVNATLAKAEVWERGYFYAAAAQTTYELAVDTTFIFEKQADGEWKILAHDGSSQGIPPNKVTDPMPDLRAEYYAKCGPACDPVADAKKAKEW